MKIEIDVEDLRRLYDLATDSPLVCSGNFETEDVRVLRRLALKIGANVEAATPDEFVRDFPHAYVPTTIGQERRWIPIDGSFQGGRMETSTEALTRLGGSLPTTCVAGSRARRCGREADHPIHQPGAPEPTSDPDTEI